MQESKALTRFQQFFAAESAGGVLLLACAVIALAWANSPWGDSYFDLWHNELTIGVRGFALSMELHRWINDGLMVLFFFVVGLELKRELLVGELSQLKQAALPIFGAIGGMLIPALIYAAINLNSGALQGWGIPVATDIAFALAILTLLGPRVPTGLKVLLVALAIVDDLGAVLVIALFYTQEIHLAALCIAVLGLAGAALMNRLGVIRPVPYVAVGIMVWLAVLFSGVHATVAGVMLALCIPARSRINMQAFYQRCRDMLAQLERTINPQPGEQPIESQELRLSSEQQELVGEIERVCEEVQPPLDRLEHGLHPWIALVVMPLFALANAGVAIPPNFNSFLNPVSLGVILGLVLGKQLGVFAFVWLSVRFKLAVLPDGVTWRHIHGVAWVCGVGFTMSLFIASLAFKSGPQLLDNAKLGILVASLLAGTVGYLVLRRATSAEKLTPSTHPTQMNNGLPGSEQFAE